MVRIETTLGTHKVMKYDFNTTPDQIMANIVKKDPIPDIQVRSNTITARIDFG